ncbi:hypothetical protein BMR1_03g02015 [Babesia microti strain RI]|uniref:Uncharacterized protein n=1 Tax=Babesia microti (strain RI) TaxID=1133968 RepID=A0A0K3ANB0_BABMR|nr:hypothetical protein BMR1_03g02015 [Babesia microti strain RI]CTQ41002.1 hypothetical protein BMR1_03g02015 [Babesia microti strain RI]|eukprot:XP_012649013.1 hypothetical protein BMR1_03g02015 [Babesia microti strain RI]
MSVVPSPVTVSEAKYTIGTRKLTILEKLGLLTIPNRIQFRYIRNTAQDIRNVLSKEYPEIPVSKTHAPSPAARGSFDQAVVDVLRARQESIRKEVVARNGLTASVILGFTASGLATRHYDLKTKLIVVPVVTYMASWVGRAAGDLFAGRWSENARDRFLGSLPAYIHK